MIDVDVGQSKVFSQEDYDQHGRSRQHPGESVPQKPVATESGNVPWVVSTSWRMPHNFDQFDNTATVPLSLAIIAVESTEEGTATAFDDVTLCQSSDGCLPAYPQCNKQSLDVLLLVDNSGSITGKAKFNKARAFVKELYKSAERDSNLAEPKVDRVRVEIATFAQRSGGTLQIIWDGIRNDRALSDDIVTTIDDVIDAAIVRSMIDNHKTNIGAATLLAVKDEFVTRSKSSMRAVVIITDGDDEKTEPNSVFAANMERAKALATFQGKTCFYVMSSDAATHSGAAQSDRVVRLRNGDFSPPSCNTDAALASVAQQDGPKKLADYLLKDGTVLVGEHSCNHGQSITHCLP